MTWVLLDYTDMVVHVFYEETRRFYDIERLYRYVPVVDGGPPPYDRWRQQPAAGFHGPIRGCSSVGRALPWHGRGQGFDSPQLHSAARRARSSVELRSAARRRLRRPFKRHHRQRDRFVLSIGLGGSARVPRRASARMRALLGDAGDRNGSAAPWHVAVRRRRWPARRPPIPDGDRHRQQPGRPAAPGVQVLRRRRGRQRRRARLSQSGPRSTPSRCCPPGGRARATVPGPAAGHPDPDRRGADLGGPRPRRRVLHQPADGLPVRDAATPTSGGSFPGQCPDGVRLWA